MRSALFAIAALSVLGSTPASAQVTPAVCLQLSDSVGRAAEGSTGYLEGLVKADTGPFAAEVSGDLKAAAQRASQAREVLMPAMRNYVRALEDLAYQLKVCARR